jgi:hypothetical protein
LAFTPADKYVTPTGIAVFDRMFGGNTKGGPYGNGGNPGGIFGADPFGTTQWSWNRQLNGGGVADPTSQLTGAIDDSTSRYFGDGTYDPESGFQNNSWQNRADIWFMRDKVGPDGVVLPSAYKQTGLRIGQDYGVNRDAQGNVADPWHSEMFQSALGIRNNLNQDRWLDPYQAQEGLRALQQDSPWAMPNAGDYLSTMQSATGGPGAADYYGQRGVNQTNALADTNIRQLNRNIDREMELSLGNQLPEISQAMEAAGLGRSGAGQLQLMQANNAAREQAIRDKNRTMADYTDREAGRRAEAINLGSQIGAQGYGQYSQQMGQAALAGLGDVFQANQTNRNNEAAQWSQQMQNRYTKNQGDQNALFQMLAQSGQFGLGQLDAERMGQSQALSDYMGIFNQREKMRSDSLNEMLGLSERNRAIEQERINQMIQAGYLPLNMMQTMITGVQGNAGSNGGQTSPWWQGAANGVAQGVGQEAAGWFGNWIGNG